MGSLEWAADQAYEDGGDSTIVIASGVDVIQEYGLSTHGSLVIRAEGVSAGERATITLLEDEVLFQFDGGDEENAFVLLDGLDLRYAGEDPYRASGIDTGYDVCMTVLRDVSIVGFPDVAVHLESSWADAVRFIRVVLAENGFGENQPAGAFTMGGEGAGGRVLIEDSVFRDNVSPGIAIDGEDNFQDDQGIHISRTLFQGNGAGSESMSGGAISAPWIHMDTEFQGPILTVTDSVFIDNIGNLAGGIAFARAYTSEDHQIRELVRISGSTFQGNAVTEPVRADDPAGATAIVIDGDGTAPQNTFRALNLMNSTVEGPPGTSLPGISMSGIAGALSIQHSTLVNAGIGVLGADYAATAVELRNSVLENGVEQPLRVTEGEGDPEEPASLTITEEHMAYTVAPEAIEPGPGRVLVSDIAGLQLGDLAAQEPCQGCLGLPVRIPEQDSPLVDAAQPSELATDQLGTARPQGPAADIGAVEVPVIAGQVALLEDVTVSEGEDAVFTVTRSGGSDGEASVLVSTSDGSAVAGEDYTATSVRLSWAAGEDGPKTVSVPTLTDALIEPEQTFTVSLSEPSEGLALGEPSTVSGTILDATVPGADGDADSDGDSDADADADGAGDGAADAAASDADAATDADAAGDGGTDATDGGTATAKPGTDPLANTGSNGGGGLFLAALGLLLGGLVVLLRRVFAGQASRSSEL
ncbi:Calx-beta domain-containing protein [Leucobacter sp. M11]|uniref:Calx-beta domain-containing protein n=1 Tax=Leucobacter sp. M11 TaxID=2993565 RepID=UPI002D7F85AA|nr:Calx-beta domain-containing protein [Leucobacter sp. M11]